MTKVGIIICLLFIISEGFSQEGWNTFHAEEAKFTILCPQPLVHGMDSLRFGPSTVAFHNYIGQYTKNDETIYTIVSYWQNPEEVDQIIPDSVVNSILDSTIQFIETFSSGELIYSTKRKFQDFPSARFTVHDTTKKRSIKHLLVRKDAFYYLLRVYIADNSKLAKESDRLFHSFMIND